MACLFALSGYTLHRLAGISSLNWPADAQNRWLMIKPSEEEQKEAGLVEYECLSCHRRYRLRGTKLYEVLADGSERAYMRQGQYGRWLSRR